MHNLFNFPLVVACLGLGTTAPGTETVKGIIDYQRDVKPILTRACVGCHGPEKQRAGLRLDSRQRALEGGDSGPVIKPGDAASTRLLKIVAGLDPEVTMPPKGKPRLTTLEIGILRDWIDQGMKWPVEKSGKAPGSKASHWAFQPAVRSTPPDVKQGDSIRNPLDRFIRARLEQAGFASAPEADRATLVRRLSLDLIGLPPTPAEVDAVLNDPSPDWYEKLVDRLLASPHHGEKWSRHWLDAARYADSDGYEKDTGRPFAWRWRNWAIEAFNRDLAYDRFIVEQLAGDLLPNATVEQKVATGFHRNTLTNKEGGVDQEQFRVEAVVDRVNTTAKAFLGITLGCAQCHDHKYDPFTQREYYQFFAYFNSDAETNIAAPTGVGNARYDREKALHEARHKQLVEELEEARKKLTANLKPDEIKKKLAPQQQKLTAHVRAAPQPPLAQTLSLGKVRPTHVMIRGDFLRKGVEVQTGVPAVLGGARPRTAGNRLDLARWIASAENPLTARVLVNWTWHRFFGRGLIPTLDDLGTQGDKPSHLELLDWLACRFTEDWSMKNLHRVIVTSATYRQSSRGRPELAQRDPLNVLLARQNRLRLEAELIRDHALASSGLLASLIGGPSVRPPQPPGIAELSYAGSVKWIESQGADRYRRGLYTWFQRTSPYPMLLTFDAPDGNLCAVKRDRSNTPLQALTLLNDTVFVESAQALGRRLIAETPSGDVRARVIHGFRLVLGRQPRDAEVIRLTRLYEDMLGLCKASPEEAAKLVGKSTLTEVSVPEAAAWIAFGRALLNLDEVVMRE